MASAPPICCCPGTGPGSEGCASMPCCSMLWLSTATGACPATPGSSCHGELPAGASCTGSDMAVCQRPSPLRRAAGLNTFLVHVCRCLHAVETERSTRAQVSRWRSAALALARASPDKSHPKVWCRVLSQYTLRERCMQIRSCACSAFAHAVRRHQRNPGPTLQVWPKTCHVQLTYRFRESLAASDNACCPVGAARAREK